MNIVRTICQLLLLAVATHTWAADEPLIWKFQAGDEHHYQMTQLLDMQIALGAADRNIGTGVQQVVDMTWKVERVDDKGHARIRQTVDRARMNIQSPDQPELEYDTDSEEDPAGFAAMLSPLYKAMVDKAFTMTMSTRGAISEIAIPEALTAAIEGVPGAAMLGEMISHESFKLILPLPQDLTPGHEWTSKSNLKNPQLGNCQFEMTYRYLGPREVEGTEYEVFSAKLKINFGEGAAGAEIEIVDHNSTGEILFDRAAGHLESSKLQQDIELQVLVGGQVMNQKMIQKVFFERVKKP